MLIQLMYVLSLKKKNKIHPSCLILSLKSGFRPFSLQACIKNRTVTFGVKPTGQLSYELKEEWC